MPAKSKGRAGPREADETRVGRKDSGDAEGHGESSTPPGGGEKGEAGGMARKEA